MDACTLCNGIKLVHGLCGIKLPKRPYNTTLQQFYAKYNLNC